MQVTVLLGLHNEASEMYNVSAILGSLNSPTDFSIFVQNFTNQVCAVVKCSNPRLPLQRQPTNSHSILNPGLPLPSQGWGGGLC